MATNLSTPTPAKRRRGNPDWSRGFGLHGFDMPQPSKFEELLKKLNLDLAAPCQELAEHPKVEEFARKNVQSHFVPEGLLGVLGLREREVFGEG